MVDFGDMETHGRTGLPQLETYLHRFGTRMIVYGFCHTPIDRLGRADGDITVVGWQLPEAYANRRETTREKQYIDPT